MNKILAGLGLLLFSHAAFGSSIVISPPFLQSGQTGVVLSVVGVGTNFSGTPFSKSGGTLVITAQTVTDATHATITVTTGNATQTGVTISDLGGDTYVLFVFNLDHDTVASGLTRVLPVATGGTIDSGALTDTCSVACWGVAGGSVLLAPVTTAGSYTVVPAITFAAANGSYPGHPTATATATLFGGGLANPLTLTNGGRDYVSLVAPTASGGTGSGAVFGTPTITGNTLQTAGGTCSNTAFGSQCWLLRPSSVNTLNQMISVKFVQTASTDRPTIVARVSTGTAQLYSCQVSLGVTCFYLNNYVSGSAPIVTSGAAAAAVIGHEYLFQLAVTGSSPSTVHEYLFDLTTSTVIANSFGTDSSAGVQTSNQVGVGYVSSIQAIEEVTSFIGGMVCSPSAVNLNIASQSVSCTAVGTSWTPGTPGTPVFTTTGSASACAITAQTITSTTAVTFTINTGATAGSCVINDPSTGGSGLVQVTALVAPAALITNVPGTAANISATGPATFANSPLAYRVYRSPNVNFNPATDPQAVLISTQTGVSGGVTPTPVVDSTPPTGISFYVWQVTDNSGQVGYGLEAGATIYVPWGGGNIGTIGDSISVGHTAVALIQRIVDPVVVSGGSGFTSTPSCPVTGGGPNPMGGHITVHVTAGSIDYAYPDDQPFEYGFTSESVPATCTVTGGGGTGGVITLNSGGGWGLALQQILQEQFGMKGVYVIQAGRGGTAASSWQPGSTLLNRAYAMFGSPALTPVIIMQFGPNDANGGVTQAQYITNMENILTDIVGRGYKVIVLPPMYNRGATQVQNALIQQYVAAIPTIVAQYPGQVTEGSNSLWNWSIFYNPSMFTDGLHPNDAGYGIMGGDIALPTSKIIKLSSPRPNNLFIFRH